MYAYCDPYKGESYCPSTESCVRIWEIEGGCPDTVDVWLDEDGCKAGIGDRWCEELGRCVTVTESCPWIISQAQPPPCVANSVQTCSDLYLGKEYETCVIGALSTAGLWGGGYTGALRFFPESYLAGREIAGRLCPPFL